MTIGFDYLHMIDNIKDPLLQDAFSWQLHVLGHWTWRYQDNGELIEAVITPVSKNQFNVHLNNKEQNIIGHLSNDTLRIEIENQSYKALTENTNQSLTLYTEQGQITIERFHWNKLDSQATLHKGQLTAPMPATVVAILKKIGEPVKAGDRLIILEAMKMEHAIHAPADGVLLDVFYAVGAQVSEGAELVSLSESDS